MWFFVGIVLYLIYVTTLLILWSNHPNRTSLLMKWTGWALLTFAVSITIWKMRGFSWKLRYLCTQQEIQDKYIPVRCLNKRCRWQGCSCDADGGNGEDLMCPKCWGDLDFKVSNVRSFKNEKAS